MSNPDPHIEPRRIGMPSSGEMKLAGARIVEAGIAILSNIPESRRAKCLSCATALTLTSARRFQPRWKEPAELRWCGPQGEPAPAIAFPKSFLDRRTTVAWALYRMTVATPVDEPIFSAQARVTLHDDSLATFSNFDAPAATFISSEHEGAVASRFEMPDAIVQQLRQSTTPLVYAVMQQMAGFDDVILYTSLFNFGTAFCAYQTGPWRTLKDVLLGAEPVFDEEGFSLAERRAVERAALSAVELAWESCYRREVEFIGPAMIGTVTSALSRVKP